jgi:hypothetical protein
MPLFCSEGSALGRMVAPVGSRAAGNDLGGRSDHYRQQQQQQQIRRVRPEAVSSAPPSSSSAVAPSALSVARKEIRLVSGTPGFFYSSDVSSSDATTAGIDLQTFLPRSDAVFGDHMAAMLAPHDRCGLFV